LISDSRSTRPWALVNRASGSAAERHSCSNRVRCPSGRYVPIPLSIPITPLPPLRCGWIKSDSTDTWSCPPMGPYPRMWSSSSHESSATRAASITKVIAVGSPSGGITMYERQGQKASRIQDRVRSLDPR
jgi:hypothetical protein